jgi:transposase
MKSARYAAEYKTKAVKQVTEGGYRVVEVAKRLGVSDKSLYAWIKQARQQLLTPRAGDVAVLRGELARLKAELKRTAEERDMLKKAAAYFARVAA